MLPGYGEKQILEQYDSFIKLCPDGTLTKGLLLEKDEKHKKYLQRLFNRQFMI